MARQRTAEQWRREVEAWRASGASAVAYAKGRGYSTSSLRRWAAIAAEPGFVRLQVVPTADVRVEGVVVELGGATVRVQRGFDAELLRSVVDALTPRGGK